ncbi:hypothetical protein KFK09_006946 [Dendrobium nobile]|uniref:Uncharacterized protein n=1 Tax=Dendrobium nobile TaxID=94219 RepID=A0A8T3BUY0_DENNO|nr:hypothetical protein KFK09_006946 [Dendrobium nobile]
MRRSITWRYRYVSYRGLISEGGFGFRLQLGILKRRSKIRGGLAEVGLGFGHLQEIGIEKWDFDSEGMK